MRPRLLILESEPDIARLFRMLFPAECYDVCLVETLQAGRRALARHVDLVLLEPVLPDGDGLAFCREIRRRCRTLPVVVVTTRVGAGRAARASGATAFVAKPFDPDTLVGRIEGLLARRHRARRRA